LPDLRDFRASVSTGSATQVEAIREPSARATATTNLATGLGRLLAGRLNLLIYRNFLKRMKGLEPSTFCMAMGTVGPTLPDAAYGISMAMRNRRRGVRRRLVRSGRQTWPETWPVDPTRGPPVAMSHSTLTNPLTQWPRLPPQASPQQA
jgi:hypothetical protein